MEKINDLDLEGRLQIIQSTELGTYTFDSVLLANFVNFRKKDIEIIDFCTGNAPIAMLLTLKKEKIKIKAIEIQQEIALLAEKSIKLNKLTNKIELITDNLINISEKIGKNKYDVITCNPPYFRVEETSNLNEKKEKTMARHEITVNLEQIIIEAKKLLNNTGTLNMVHRPERLDEIIMLSAKYNFTIKRIQFIYPKITKESNTILIELKKGIVNNNKVKIEKPIIIYDQQQNYTEEAKKIMNLEG